MCKALPVVMLLALMFIPSFLKSARMQRVPTGVWGGEHVEMNVTNASASLEYDCAAGTITGPLTLNRNGEFKWRGFHSPEHGGPVRDDEEGNRLAVAYTGTVHGNTLTLTVRRTDDNEDLGTYTLTRGNSGQIFKCR